MMLDPKGAVWRRWEPHVHAPGTLLNDQFRGVDSLDKYLEALAQTAPALAAIGITDYFSLGCYKRVVEAVAGKQEFADRLLFPNIELRLSIDTDKSKGINLHLLVSPEDGDHVEQAERFLSTLTFEFHDESYACTTTDLARLGRVHNSRIVDRIKALENGANQFKVDLPQLKAQYKKSRWAQDNILIAVAGSATDGTSGLSSDASFDAMRREIERFAHIIFASSPKQTEFWRGESSLTPAEIADRYGALKPCLHGSDAHSTAKVGKPELDRFSWIKGDPTFDALRHACLEPASRVFIGSDAPRPVEADRSLAAICTPTMGWLLPSELPLNPGLVTIIGARGSGKTALADLLAVGAGDKSPLLNDRSFLARAKDLLGNTQVRLTWSDGQVVERGVHDDVDDIYQQVHYLSQQFVDKLCSSDGATDELEHEIQRVVFAANDSATRQEATDFSELLETRTGDHRRQKAQLAARLDQISEEYQVERVRRAELPAKRKALEELRTQLKRHQEARHGLIKAGSEERANYYQRLRTAMDARDRGLQAIDRQKQQLVHLRSAVDRLERTELPGITSDLRSQWADAGLSDTEWTNFHLQFTGAPREAIDSKTAELSETYARLEAGEAAVAPLIGTSSDDLKRAPLESLKAEASRVAEEIGMDRTNAQRLTALNERVQRIEVEIVKADAEVSKAEGAEERQNDLSRARAECYREYFELVVREEEALRSLYAPLESRLSGSSDSIAKLRLVVLRGVDVASWANAGERLFDLRTGLFRGTGTLEKHAREMLLPAWEEGDAEAVSAAMSAFRTKFDRAIVEQYPRESPVYAGAYQRWAQDVGRWLYSTDHVSVQYSFEYDSVPLGQLSPGTRGIVLLLLYLALDQEDGRPLIIDQPEENLDPKSVFSELVGLFRSIRLRRQVIIVTHNANLVVNTDADQVIVASSSRSAGISAPTFEYVSGSLENPHIRSEVCEILEGGEAAFRERAKRLRVRDL